MYVHYLVRFFILLIFLSSCSDTPPCQPVKSELKTPEWTKNLSIYELNIRQFSQEGTFKAVQNRLDELKAMHVGIIWLMPIHPIGEKNRKGTLGSYYSVQDYKGINPEFGTEEDFRNLVKAIHDKGMYVIIDWVANHTAWDHHWTKEHPEFYTKNEKGEFIPPVADWEDVIDLNYDNPDLRAAMTDAMEYWVRDFNIDGFRCDVAGMVPTDFWDEARKKLDEIKPVFMLAEAEQTDLHINAFDMTYGWNMHHVFNAIAQGKKTAADLVELINKEACEYPQEAYRMRFVDNHDENSWNGTTQERLGAAEEVFTVLSATLPGMPLLYSGDEAGLDKRLEFFEKDTIPWKAHSNRTLYTKLFELKEKHKSLFNGNFGGNLEWISTTNNHIFAFSRQKEDEKILVVSNLSDNEQKFQFDIPKQFQNPEILLSKSGVHLISSRTNTMPAWSYAVYLF